MKHYLCISFLICACLFSACDRIEPEQNAMKVYHDVTQSELSQTSKIHLVSEIEFWEQKQRMGANSFNNKPPSQAYFDSFAEYGGEWIRLSWTKWQSAGGKAFLIGDPSDYTGLVQEDVFVLKEVVSRARNSKVKLVFTSLTLPGAVWSQHNNGEIDDRLYSDKKYWEQSALFWQDIAEVFKDDETIIAYNIINEPTPERPSGYERGTREQNIQWYEQQIGTPRDLPAFYEYIVHAIREIDTVTPIMIDGGFFGNPNGFDYFEGPIQDDKILYDFHMYQPWAATSTWNIRNGAKLVYPGTMEYWGRTETWDAERVAKTIQQPLDWAEKYGIQPSRIVMGEFGCHRYLKWCPIYLEDVLSAAEENNLHWAFYTFRSDNWGGMDYELGQDAPS